jgi:glycosyltransferase involved in cell wall biosynthesis
MDSEADRTGQYIGLIAQEEKTQTALSAIDVVVPVYNEGANIRHFLDELSAKVFTTKRVWLVYDFDGDDTVAVVQAIQSSYTFEIKLQKNIYSRGALNAIKTGFVCSQADAVLVTMADLSDDMRSVDQMYELFETGCDVVCGSRYMRGGRQIGGGFFKKLCSRLAGVSLHVLIGIPTHDVTNSFKLYSRKLLSSFEIESVGGFELGMELTIKAYINGMRVGEVPAIWNDRQAGKSNFKLWSWIPKYLHWYFYGIKNVWFGKKKKTCESVPQVDVPVKN